MTLMCCSRQNNGLKGWGEKGLAPHSVSCRRGDREEAWAFLGRMVTGVKGLNTCIY